VKRRDFLVTCGATVASAGWLGGGEAQGRPKPAAAEGRPNILFLLADDLGWADVGFHGSPIQTPHIDRLCREGVEMDQHYVQPMCTPTRAALLTGRYPSRFGDAAVTPCNERVLPWGTKTLASILGESGYDTGLAGKWHLGSKPEWGPSHFGFKHSYGSLAGGCGQYNHLYKKGPYSRTWHRNERLIGEDGHSTDLIAREVIGWIEQQKTPWFYYVPFTAVHVPVEVPEKFVEMYRGRTYDKDPGKDESFKRYAAYVTHMDDAIGRILNAVERTGQRENTLVIFTSDNGSFPSWRPSGKYPGRYPASPRLGSNRPLRGRKAQLYEGGIRVPTCVHWPGHLEPGKTPAVTHVVDWMPTLTRLCRCRPETDLRWDGQDIWPVITRQVTDPAPRTLYWKFHRGNRAVRHGGWKLILHGGKRVELFNLAKDPCEKRNLADRYPEKVKRLRESMNLAARADSRERPPDPVDAPKPK